MGNNDVQTVSDEKITFSPEEEKIFEGLGIKVPNTRKEYEALKRGNLINGMSTGTIFEKIDRRVEERVEKYLKRHEGIGEGSNLAGLVLILLGGLVAYLIHLQSGDAAISLAVGGILTGGGVMSILAGRWLDRGEST